MNPVDYSNPTSVMEALVANDRVVMSARTRNIVFAQGIADAGCTRKDVKNYLKKQARRAGLYAHESEFADAIGSVQKKEWAWAIIRFSKWCDTYFQSTKWEPKKSDKDLGEQEVAEIKENERREALSEAELQAEDEKKEADKKLAQEVQVAQFIKKNAAAFKRLAEKEGITTPVDTVITTITAGIEAGRIGK